MRLFCAVFSFAGSAASVGCTEMVQDGSFQTPGDELVNHIPSTKRGDLIKAYYERLIGDDELERMAAAKSWTAWEEGCSKLRPDLQALGSFTKLHNALALARLEVHYL